MTTGKNKRGDRGSTEEEQTSAKRANVAAENTSLATESSDESSLSGLREMLVDIQITIADIQLENRGISTELAQLKSTVRERKDEIGRLKISLDMATKDHAEAERALAAAKKPIDEQQEEISELYDLQDNLEQYTRKNTLEIHGVPESAYTSTEDIVLKVAEALEVPIQPQDIEISHKLNRKGIKPIIVKFLSHRARAKLKNVKISSLFHGTSYATAAEAERIFLNESLTSYRRKIENRANEKRRNGQLLSVWTLDGKIYVKTSPEGRPIRINELEDLEYL